MSHYRYRKSYVPVNDRKDSPEFQVYRCYDERDRLIYVGQTSDVEHRLSVQHSRCTPWWRYVAWVAVGDCMTYRESLAAESEAIWSEGPLVNQPHASTYGDFGWSRGWRVAA